MDTSLREMGRPTLRGTRIPNYEAYGEIRRSVHTLLSGQPAELNPVVPACPEWTLRDLVAHLAGSAALAIGKLSGWPVRHLSSSADMDLPASLAAWDALGEEVELLLSERSDRAGSLLVTDAFTHELDLHYALDATLPEEHPAFAGAFEVLANGFAAAVDAHHLPALCMSTGDTRWTVGTGDPVATVTAHRYDLYRSLAGRRSHEQITALDWDRDSHRWLPAFSWGPFTPPDSPVEPTVDTPSMPQQRRSA